MKTLITILLMFACLAMPALGADMTTMTATTQVVQEIRSAVLAAPSEHPLPLAASWCTGAADQTFQPPAQLALIAQGHHVLPWISLATYDSFSFATYYQPAMTELARLNLPFVARGTQWESLFQDSNYPWKYATGDDSPLMVGADGTINYQAISAYGPVKHWTAAGTTWTSDSLVKKLEAIYPNPPRVIWLSNNESVVQRWSQFALDRRYPMALADAGVTTAATDLAKSQIINMEVGKRFKAMQAGMIAGLTTWKTNSIFVGYNVLSADYYARISNWSAYAKFDTARVDCTPDWWDGGSAQYYVNDWDNTTDFKVWSPQVGFQSIVFQLKDALALHPNFWFEYSVWNGHTLKGDGGDKPNIYRQALGQSYTPDRYSGQLRFGLWLMRPRVLREFRFSNTTPGPEIEPYWMALVGVVDQVWGNAKLTSYWKNGTLVANRAHKHPFNDHPLDSLNNPDRLFMLDCDRNPSGSSGYPPLGIAANQEIKVFALAYVQGTAPNRKWLVYTHSPVSAQAGAVITIPDYKTITVTSPVAGAFYEVSEATGTVSDALAENPWVGYDMRANGAVSTVELRAK